MSVAQAESRSSGDDWRSSGDRKLEPCVDGLRSEFGFDVLEPVVFGHPFASCRCTRLDLAGMTGDREIGDEAVGCLA